MLPVISVATECPPLYELRNDTYKSCYMFVGDYLTWYEAELYCKTTGGHLVALETSDEQEFLIDYVQKSNSECLLKKFSQNQYIYVVLFRALKGEFGIP